jgi:Fur family ferric uptake transcriptional regulator
VFKDESPRPDINAVREVLAEADARLTPQREAVLRALLTNANQHQSAEEVHQAARKYLPEIGLATVYRTLELFGSLGVVHQLHTAEGQSRFEFNAAADEHYHHHVICISCGAISECNEDLLEVLEEKVINTTGYQVIDHCLQFYGYCPRCQEERTQR